MHPVSGAIKWIRALGGTDYASDGTPTHFDGVTVDVSAQKLDQQKLASLNHQLRQQDRRKDDFIATLSHELRNPLAPIRAAAKVIASPQVAPAQLQRAQLIIERQVTHMALLLDDLLDVARITQGKLQLKKETVALIDVVDAAVEAVRPTLSGKNHELSLSLPAEPVLLDADPLRLSQILSNLLVNAAKYSDAGSHIELAATVKGNTVSLSVKDNGIGFDAQSFAEMFTMFAQVKSSIDRAEGGLGIGLALVKGLVALHGGSVEAVSAGLGRGSEFVIHLPASVVMSRGEPAGAPDPKPAQGGGNEGLKVVVADDNRDAADSMAMILRLSGHEVWVAHSGEEALQIGRQVSPAVMILDIGMPALSGYEVAAAVRAEAWGRDILLLAVTGWGQAGDKDKAKAAGFNHHLTKPVDLDRVEQLLRGSSQ